MIKSLVELFIEDGMSSRGHDAPDYRVKPGENCRAGNQSETSTV